MEAIDLPTTAPPLYSTSNDFANQEFFWRAGLNLRRFVPNSGDAGLATFAGGGKGKGSGKGPT